MPNGTFQQTKRCRNIQTLYYYSECKEVVKTSFNNTNEDHVEYEYDIDEQCRLLDVIM